MHGATTISHLSTPLLCEEISNTAEHSSARDTPFVVIFILLWLPSMHYPKDETSTREVVRIDGEPPRIKASGTAYFDFKASERGATITKTSRGHLDWEHFSSFFLCQRLNCLASVFLMFTVFGFPTQPSLSLDLPIAAFSRVAYTLDDSLTALMTQGGMNCFSSTFFDSDLITL